MPNQDTPTAQGRELERQTRTLGLGALVGIAVVLVGIFAAAAGVTISRAHERDRAEAVAIDENASKAEVRAALVAALDDLQETGGNGIAPLKNTAGDHVFSSLYVDDGTGVVTTPNDAGVFTAIAGSPMAAGESDGSGCLTASATTGLFTVAKVCGRGTVELLACFADFSASSNVGGTTTIKWEANGAAITGAPVIRKTEPVDAGNARSSIGCAGPFLYDADLDDTLGVYLTNAGGGITGTTRSAAFRVIKVLNK